MNDNPFVMFAVLWGAFGIWRCAFLLSDIRKLLKDDSALSRPQRGIATASSPDDSAPAQRLPE